MASAAGSGIVTVTVTGWVGLLLGLWLGGCFGFVLALLAVFMGRD